MQENEETYQNYIKFMLEQKEDSTVIDILYQRAIATFPLSTDLWMQYLHFLVSFTLIHLNLITSVQSSNFSSVRLVLLKGHEQSIRNCPWMPDFWISYCQTLERLFEPHDKVTGESIFQHKSFTRIENEKATFERALSDNYTEGNSYFCVWRAYCDYFHRKASGKTSGNMHVQQNYLSTDYMYMCTCR